MMATDMFGRLRERIWQQLQLGRLSPRDAPPPAPPPSVG